MRWLKRELRCVLQTQEGHAKRSELCNQTSISNVQITIKGKQAKATDDRKVKQECFIISCHAIVTWDPTKFLSDYNQVCLNNRVNHLII